MNRGFLPPFFMALKDLLHGEEMPKDFWNYNVNPILGYKYEKIARNRELEKKKYGIKPI